MKTLKRLVLGSFLLILFVVGAAIIFIFTLDPNRLKPILVKAAAEQGLQLSMGGDIGWQLYPKLGLSLGEIKLTHKSSGLVMAEVKHTRASVQLRPLLDRKVFIDGVELDGLQLFYTIDADGSSVWETLTTAEEVATEPVSGGATETPELSIHKVRISNSSLNYEDKKNAQKANVTIVQLNADDITLHGQAFPLVLIVKVASTGVPVVQLDLQSHIALNLDQQTIKMTQSAVSILIGTARVDVSVSADTSWAEPLASNGSIAVKPFNLPALMKAFDIAPPVTANAKALQKVSAAFDYQFKGESISLSKLSLGVDDFEMKGQVSVNNFAKPEIKTILAGTRIVLDDYLPPPVEQTKSVEPVAAPTALPMEMLRELNVDANVGIDQMVYSGLNLDKTQINVTAKKGIIKLEKLYSKVAEGTVNVNALLDATSVEAKLNADIKTQDINVGQLLKIFAEMDDLQGNASVEILASSHGKTDQDLIDNLMLNGRVHSKGLSISPFNIEQQFCEGMALLHQAKAPQHEWAKKTDLQPVELKFSLMNNNLKLENLSAEIAHLTGAADGTLNLQTGKFDIPLKLSIGDFAGDIQGCLPISDKWRKRQLPMRCKGNLDNIGAKTCLPDVEFIGSLIKDELKNKVKGKADEKIEKEKDRAEEKAKEKAQELLKKELGEEDSSEVKEGVKGLLNKLKKK